MHCSENGGLPTWKNSWLIPPPKRQPNSFNCWIPIGWCALLFLKMFVTADGFTSWFCTWETFKDLYRAYKQGTRRNPTIQTVAFIWTCFGRVAPP